MGEGAGLLWRDVDLDKGTVSLDENKTSDPRTWTLDPGTHRALRIWREMHPEAKANDPVFGRRPGPGTSRTNQRSGSARR
jgi:integrase